jgi:hypothetical protein
MQLFAAILYGRNERGEIDSVNGRQRIRFLHAISLEYNLTKTISEPTFWGVVSADCSMSQYSHQQQKHDRDACQAYHGAAKQRASMPTAAIGRVL